MQTPVFFHADQLLFSPPYEWDKRGYVKHPENPKRINSILKALKKASGDFVFLEPDPISQSVIQQVHRSDFLRLYQLAQENIPSGQYFYPTFFPKAHQRDSDPDNIHHAGYYCTDTSTPLGPETLISATWSAATAYSAASHLLEGKSNLVYALTRPPGHHASADYFGGYCYFNNAAIAANRLKEQGSVAIIDIDFHHGDGTQSIFYFDNQVLTVSIHADPNEHFPYFSGHANEIGEGAGRGFNLNIPLMPGTDGDTFLQVLTELVVPRIKEFAPAFLIVAFGADTYHKDPICDFKLDTPDYNIIAKQLASLNLPTLVTQEGGYFVPALGDNVVSFLSGLR